MASVNWSIVFMSVVTCWHMEPNRGLTTSGKRRFFRAQFRAEFSWNQKKDFPLGAGRPAACRTFLVFALSSMIRLIRVSDRCSQQEREKIRQPIMNVVNRQRAAVLAKFRHVPSEGIEPPSIGSK